VACPRWQAQHCSSAHPSGTRSVPPTPGDVEDFEPVADHSEVEALLKDARTSYEEDLRKELDLKAELDSMAEAHRVGKLFAWGCWLFFGGILAGLAGYSWWWA
jgi:hypothetical protein